MARLFSLPVVGGGALLASPALWAALVDGTMAVETALGRWGIAIVACWFGLSLLASLVEGTAIQSRPVDVLPADPPVEARAGGRIPSSDD